MGLTLLRGWQFALALALVWLLIGLLHSTRVKPARVVVPLLELWTQLGPGGPLARARRRITRSLSLACALSFALLATLAAARPRPAWLTAIGPARTRLIVLDAGRSMQAVDVLPSRFARARALAQALIDARPRHTTLLLAQLDAGVTPLSGPSDDEAALRAALGRARPTLVVTRLAAAVEYARTQLQGRPNPELVLISDGASADPPSLESLTAAGISVRQVSVGSSAHNVAIRAFSVRAQAWDAQRCEALIELENADRVEHALELTLYEDDAPIDLRRLTLPAQTRARHFYPLAASGQRLVARITPITAADTPGPADDQPLDDVAYAVLAQRPLRRVLWVSSGDRYVEAALALDPHLQVERIAPSAYRGAEARAYDLAIFDRFAPPEPPGVPSLYLAAPASPSGSPLRVTGKLRRPYFESVARDHPMLRQISLRDVNIAEAQRVALEPGDRALASAAQGPLIVAGERGGAPFIALTFDLRHSDLPLRVAWPMLLARSLALLGASAPDLELPLYVGRPMPLPAAAPPVRARDPAGLERELPVRGAEAWIRPQRAGFHALAAVGSLQLAAANLDPIAEPTIAPRRIAPELELPGSGAARALEDEPGLWLLACALLVLAVYWLLQARSARR